MPSTNQPSLKINALLNFIGLMYSSAVSILLLPFFLQYIGPQGFGLVGFFTVLHAWLQLLDIGMSPMLARSAAQARSTQNTTTFHKVLRSVQLVLLVIGLSAAASIFFNSKWIAQQWLHVDAGFSVAAAQAVVLMGFIIALRLFAAVYRSALQGWEAQVSVNIINMFFATLRYVGALLLLIFVTRDVVHFFCYQLSVTVLEVLCLHFYLYHKIPLLERLGFRFFHDTMKSVAPFAASVAFAGVLWVVLTQLDKIVLSNILSLEEFGYLALAAAISGGILQLASPVATAILPRLTSLYEQGKQAELIQLYRNATQYVACIVIPLAGIIAAYPEEVLMVWSGNLRAAEFGSSLLFWLVLGNSVLSFSAFLYYLQHAHGRLRLHVLQNLTTAFVQIPTILLVAYSFGPLAVVRAWFIICLVSFVVWAPIVQSRFAGGLFRRWIIHDILPALAAVLLPLTVLRYAATFVSGLDRVELACYLVVAYFIVLLCCIASTRVRAPILSILGVTAADVSRS